MCTLSAVVRRDELRVVMNRDEQRTRPAALAPEIQERSGGLAVFPRDPAGAGTWIAATDSGLVFALLNRSTSNDSTYQSAPGRLSRGRVVLDLLDSDTLEDVELRFRQTDPTNFAPFRLAVVSLDSVSIYSSDGLFVSSQRHDLRRGDPFMLTSSGLGDEVVGPPRTALFDDMIRSPARRGAPVDLFALQDAYHAHRWVAHPELSVLMSRADARTVSRTTVGVSEHSVTMTYLAEEPCAEPIRVELARVNRTSGRLEPSR